MREDSWQVQQRLTTKYRWQRGQTEGLSVRSLCGRLWVILAVFKEELPHFSEFEIDEYFKLICPFRGFLGLDVHVFSA